MVRGSPCSSRSYENPISLVIPSSCLVDFLQVKNWAFKWSPLGSRPDRIRPNDASLERLWFVGIMVVRQSTKHSSHYAQGGAVLVIVCNQLFSQCRIGRIFPRIT